MSKQAMRQALDALDNCLDDSKEILAQYVDELYGPTYKQERVKRQREYVRQGEEAITALRQAIDAETNIGLTLDQFLCNGTRIKLNFNKAGNMTSLQNMAHDLQGRWVALVPAENVIDWVKSFGAQPKKRGRASGAGA